MDKSCSFFALLLLTLLASINKTLSSLDQDALLAFKNAIITFDPSNDALANWSSNAATNTSACYWIGVSCGAKHQRVTALDVSGFGLTGPLPPHLGNLTFLRRLNISLNNFTGTVPSELSRLHRLREFNASYNLFSGEIPSWFGDLPRLEILSLRNNTFSGEIPASLCNENSKLQVVNARYNRLSGSIPEGIGNCSSLQILKLDHNRLTGSIPHGVFNLSSIAEVWIPDNELSGSLPSDMCNNLPNLTMLMLSTNQLEGRIPQNIWKCRELEYLDLSSNRLNGEIPSEMGSLSKLTVLDLGHNDFKGGIPSELGSLSWLEILNLPNASLTGTIPNRIGNCTSMQMLGLNNNQLRGPIPNQIWNWTSLRYLYLEKNYLTGSLPLKLAVFNLKRLHLDINELDGEIPNSIANATYLTELQLSGNSFSGSIPDFGSLRNLECFHISGNNLTGAKSPGREMEFLSSLTECRFLDRLDISRNPLNGILPASIGNLSTSLRVFRALHCNITGVIPSTVGNLTGLQSLFLEGNQLSGLIPPTIGNLKQLQGLRLVSNQLQGYMPPDLCRLSSLVELNLSDNAFTGPIPECLGELDSLKYIYLDSNELNSTVPSDFWNLKDLVFLNLSSNHFTGGLSSQISSLRTINRLDLSHNQLSGHIPGSIDGCQVLEVLYLSNNNFEGSIPGSLGKMRGLSALDLSNNNLSGFIPMSFEALSSLQYFNVSCNKLGGEIPGGGPFATFTAQSFFNNSALCGAAKFQVHRCHVKDNRLMKHILLSFASIISLAAIIILVLITRRRWISKRVLAPAHISAPGATWRRISYIELVKGTNDFSETNLLGKGGYGSVFKAALSDGFVVAVKVFDMHLDRAIRSFETECEILSNVRHRNLVRIIGCCSNPEFKAIVLGYMPNGSLEKWLYSENYFLDLTQRLQIAIDVASALEYLHHGHTFPVVHCDVKPSNVLLDKDMVAHLADFGMSKLFEDGETTVQTKTMATIGYAAPEYGSEGKVSASGDVYSYGVLLLEVFTRKKPTDDMFSGEMSLKEWVHRALQENDVSEVVAPRFLARDDVDKNMRATEEECASSILSLAMKCLARSPEERINMIETVNALRRIKAKVATVTSK